MLYPAELQAQILVGVERFELPTFCSQSRRATRLRYTPNLTFYFEAAMPPRGEALIILICLGTVKLFSIFFVKKFASFK